jgi:AraC-like DNA-binding protein
MPATAALLDSRAALGALRRSLPRGAAPILACRSAAGLERAIERRLLEAIVLGVGTARHLDLAGLRSRYPNIPVIAYGIFRSDDAELIQAWHRLELAAVAVEGVDDPVLGDLVTRQSVSERRRAALAGAPGLLRLTEPLQLKTWDLLVSGAGRTPRTASIARRLGFSREHLSRQFGAGGAPNLKRVADFLTVLAALHLLGNPGYVPTDVARLLGFSSPGHLRLVVRRVTGIRMEDARGLAERELLARFVRGSARSRR